MTTKKNSGQQATTVAGAGASSLAEEVFGDVESAQINSTAQANDAPAEKKAKSAFSFVTIVLVLATVCSLLGFFGIAFPVLSDAADILGRVIFTFAQANSMRMGSAIIMLICLGVMLGRKIK